MSDATAATATDTTTETTDAPATEATDFSELADLGSPDEIRKALTNSRKWEDRAKANKAAADELARVQREALPEQERIAAEAKASGAAEATARLAGRLVDAEVKAAAAGRSVDVEALLEGLDRTRFLTDDGDADTAAIQAWIDRIAPKPDETTSTQAPAGFVDLGQGARSSDTPLGSDPLLKGVKDALGIR